MGFLKNVFGEPGNDNDGKVEDAFYSVTPDALLNEDGNKMVLLEPRAFSEAQQIADYLKNRNAVVVNLKRVTSDQAKRIVDFISGTIYALGGDLKKIGGGIFLCTPNSISVQGEITDETKGKDIHDNTDIDVEW